MSSQKSSKLCSDFDVSSDFIVDKYYSYKDTIMDVLTTNIIIFIIIEIGGYRDTQKEKNIQGVMVSPTPWRQKQKGIYISKITEG